MSPYMTTTVQHMHADLADRLVELSQAVDRLKDSVDHLAERLVSPGLVDNPAPPTKRLFGR